MCLANFSDGVCISREESGGEREGGEERGRLERGRDGASLFLCTSCLRMCKWVYMYVYMKLKLGYVGLECLWN